MIFRSLKLASLALVGGALATVGALAGEFSADGKSAVTDGSTLFQVDDATTMMLAMNQQIVMTDDPKSPMNHVTGPCFGEIMIGAEGASGDGHCNWTDVDKDTYRVYWDTKGMDEAGNLYGVWEIQGGTGKWDGASGGGGWHFGPTGAADKFVNNLTGTIVLK